MSNTSGRMSVTPELLELRRVQLRRTSRALHACWRRIAKDRELLTLALELIRADRGASHKVARRIRRRLQPRRKRSNL